MAAGSATIGALRVELGLNSASFTSGLKSAQSDLGKFGKAVAIGFAAVTAAAISAGGALGVMVKGAIDSADELSKAAQKVGVTTESLSRLAYAASFSDVSLDGLTTGLKKLGANLSDAAVNKGGQAATVFKALGISVTDAQGQLKGADTVFAELSDRLAAMPDGAQKTAVAIKLLGKSGADLIPLLNGGSAELRRFADESDRLGNTVTTDVGHAAEKFNDTLSGIGQVWKGLINQIAANAIPALQSLADTLASPQFAQGASALVNAIVAGVQKLAELVEFANGARKAVADAVYNGTLARTVRKSHESQNVTDLAPGFEPGQSSPLAQPGLVNFDNIFAPATGKTLDNKQDLAAALKAKLQPVLDLGTQVKQKFTDVAEETAKAGAQVAESLQTPAQAAEAELGRLQDLLAAHAISWDEYAEASRRAMDQVAASTAASVSKVGDILGSLGDIMQSTGEKQFGISKALSVASAVLKGYEAVQSAYAAGALIGGPPIGILYAAAAAAASAANIANILSTTSTSKSMKGSGASTAASSAATPTAAAAPPQQGINLFLNGGGRYSRDEVRGLIDDINAAIRGGAKLNGQAA